MSPDAWHFLMRCGFVDRVERKRDFDELLSLDVDTHELPPLHSTEYVADFS
jgi:hypothetical protein